jgi:hypothetical protein
MPSKRGLPPEAASRPLDTLVVRDAPSTWMRASQPATYAFGGGGGVQFKLLKTVQELIDEGVLVPK